MVGKLTVSPAGEATTGGAADSSPAPADSGSASAGATELTVDAHEMTFDPTELSVPAGQEITLTVTNSGALPHEFKIDALGIDSGEVPAGGSVTVTIPALEAGSYQYHCPLPGHTEAGMVGTLTAA